MKLRKFALMLFSTAIFLSYLHAAQHSSGEFNMMPQEIIQNVMLQLSYTIGSSGVINKEDLPIVIKNIMRLARTNKSLYAILSNEDTTGMLLQALAQRFNISPVDPAVLLKTTGAQLWLKSYVKNSAEYDQYRALQKICKISDQVSNEVVEQKEIFLTSLSRRMPNPFEHQTKQGFLLLVQGWNPLSLCTPWGTISLNDKFLGGPRGGAILVRDLLKHFDWKFETIEIPARRLVRIVEFSQDDFVPFSVEAMRAEKGNKIMLFDLTDCPSMYALFAADEQILPKPIALPKNEYRSVEAIKVLWEMMENEYTQEKKQIISDEEEKKVADEPPSKNKFKTFAEPVTAAPSSTIHEIPASCIEKIKQSAKKPLQKLNKSQILILALESGCTLCEKMTEMANDASEKIKRWDEVLQRWIEEEYNYSSLEELEKAYDSIIQSLTEDWEPRTLEESPNVERRKSEEEWYLFVQAKGNKPFKVVSLLQLIIQKLNLQNKVVIDWHAAEEDRNTLYMWIRKDAFNEVNHALDAHLPLHSLWKMGNRFKQYTASEQTVALQQEVETRSHEEQS